MDQVTGGCKKLQNEKLHNLNSSLNIVRMNKLRTTRWAGHVMHMGESRNAYKILIGKPEWKSLFERPRHRQEVIIREIVLERVD
jgi:hypothetical protein